MKASSSSIGTIQEISNDREQDHIKRETTTHEVPSRNFRVLRSADSSGFERSNSRKSGYEDHISSVLDSHEMRSVSHMTLNELLEIDPSTRTEEMKNQIRCYRNRQAALASRQRKAVEMQTLKTTNQSLQSDNELLSISLQEIKETNTMLAAQLNAKLCRIMELERELSTMSQMYPLELSSQNKSFPLQ
ncbi:hypothetical protein I314_00252 [Cryptococcus bacillisporus CA1873]|uniref:BZIP domain-containing protein n=1 Tax=Cryptococcus bacillisporus CA1873 TaxID=1296111 RepID=A0ABR5BIZ4_CRYGA|nr:hypothetical protein I314_00252 [Cryptococcus bacillisporus CA1873]|eukprot:KIR69148.1 hypothetical protein I314_00252 [Cryptococcus gattii CA1873]